MCVPFLGFQFHSVCSNDGIESSMDGSTSDKSGHVVTTSKPAAGVTIIAPKADASTKPTSPATPSIKPTIVTPIPSKPPEKPTLRQTQAPTVTIPTTNATHVDRTTASDASSAAAATTPSQPKTSPAAAGTNGNIGQTTKASVTNSGTQAPTMEPRNVASVGTTNTIIVPKVVTFSQLSTAHITDTSKPRQESGGNPTDINLIPMSLIKL